MSPTESSDTSLIDAWVNEAIVQFLLNTKYYILKASLGVTANSGDYLLDTDILSFTDVWYEPSSGAQSSMLEPLDSADLLSRRLLSDPSGLAPMYYAMQGGNTLLLYPTPHSSSDQLHVLYVPRPTSTLSATSDSPSATAKGGIPDEYHHLLESYAKWKACEAEEHKPSEYGLQHQAAWERGLLMVRRDMNKKSGVFKARAKYGFRRDFPSTPGTDLKY